MWSMGAGLIPVPVADIFAVSAIQLDMVRQLCKVYEVDYKDTELKAVITAITGSVMARVGARAIKFIPGVGAAIGGVTLAVLSGASTYSLGEVFKKHFETGGTFLDFDPARLRKVYDEMFEKGKKYAREIKEKDIVEAGEELTELEADKPTANVGAKDDDMGAGILEKIKSLAQLRDQGMLTEDEFSKLKKKLIDE